MQDGSIISERISLSLKLINIQSIESSSGSESDADPLMLALELASARFSNSGYFFLGSKLYGLNSRRSPIVTNTTMKYEV